MASSGSEARVARALPAQELAGWVRHYTTYREQVSQPFQRRELPSADVVLLVSLGDVVRICPAPGERSASDAIQALMLGPHEKPIFSEHSGRQEGVHVQLAPLAAYRLVGGVESWSGSPVDLLSALGRRGAQLVEQLAAALDEAERVRLVETALRLWLRSGPRPAPQVAAAWRCLQLRHGDVAIGRLVDASGWSRSYFTRTFRRQVGVAPKTAARLLRFQRAVDLLAAGTTGSVAELATGLGYADQAHFTRDFASMAGCPPSRFQPGHIPSRPQAFNSLPCPQRSTETEDADEPEKALPQRHSLSGGVQRARGDRLLPEGVRR
jgi:AraC-like DNA-binding protein